MEIAAELSGDEQSLEMAGLLLEGKIAETSASVTDDEESEPVNVKKRSRQQDSSDSDEEHGGSRRVAKSGGN